MVIHHLHPLPISTKVWSSVSMYFIFGLPPDEQKRTGVYWFLWIDLAKSPHMLRRRRPHGSLSILFSGITACQSQFFRIVIRTYFSFLGRAVSIIRHTFADVYGSPSRDGWSNEAREQSVLGSYATSFTSWSLFLSLAEFAINNAVHVSIGLTSFSYKT